MSALTEKIAAEHRIQEVLRQDVDPRGMYVGCHCGSGPVTLLSHAAHIAEVTETAVREQIAADIEALRPNPALRGARRAGRALDRVLIEAYTRAARIARGETP